MKIMSFTFRDLKSTLLDTDPDLIHKHNTSGCEGILMVVLLFSCVLYYMPEYFISKVFLFANKICTGLGKTRFSTYLFYIHHMSPIPYSYNQV